MFYSTKMFKLFDVFHCWFPPKNKKKLLYKEKIINIVCSNCKLHTWFINAWKYIMSKIGGIFLKQLVQFTIFWITLSISNIYRLEHSNIYTHTGTQTHNLARLRPWIYHTHSTAPKMYRKKANSCRRRSKTTVSNKTITIHNGHWQRITISVLDTRNYRFRSICPSE